MKKSLAATRGFTLIEIIVVVAVISVLMMVVMASLSQARASARDKERLANLKQMQAAVEMYAGVNGRYPPACGNSTSWRGNNANYGNCAEYITGISNIMSPLPVDPKGTAEYGYLYRTNAAGTAYKILVHGSVENESVGNDHEYGRYRTIDGCPATAATKTYAVFKGNDAKCW